MAKSKKKSDPMSNVVVAVLVTALLALPAGYVIGSAGSDDSDDAKKESSHSDEEHSKTSHAHDMFAVPAASAPKISNLTVTEDAKAGWNVSFSTENFVFAPQRASGSHVDGQGHAHLYVDGEKLTRLYSNNYYIDHLDEGEHEIMVTLNTNDHKDYAVDGEAVKAMTKIVDAHHADDHKDDDHSHDDGHSHN